MEVLLRLQAFGDPGQAFGNFFLFCVFDKTVRMKMKQLLRCQRVENSVDGANILPSNKEESETTSIYRHASQNSITESVGYGTMSPNNSFIQKRESNTNTNRC